MEKINRHNFSVSFADSYKKYGLPLIFIQVKNDNGFGFEFLVDTSTKYNWIDPEYINFYTISKDTLDLDISPNELLGFLTNPYEGVYEKLSSHKIIGRDGLKQVVDKVKFNFSFEGKDYTEIFSITNTLDSFHKNKKAQVAAILGGEFLRKNKWIIDYDKLLIYSANLK